jgi:DNA-binding XRE family transcriptional regulator
MNLKELRTQLNLTQAALAKELGVTSKTISLIESGKMKLSDKLSAKINEVYGGAEAAAIAEAEKAFEAEAKAAVADKKGRKKAPAKKTATAEKKATAKKAPVAKKQSSATPLVILQSPFGGEITAEEILSKVGSVDKVYVRIDQNKAYWVKGEENGEVDLW